MGLLCRLRVARWGLRSMGWRGGPWWSRLVHLLRNCPRLPRLLWAMLLLWRGFVTLGVCLPVAQVSGLLGVAYCGVGSRRGRQLRMVLRGQGLRRFP